MIPLKPTAVSFGAVSGIVTSIGLIVGFAAAGISKPTIVAGLLIVGIADNLTDSLSIHVYQESEHLEQRAAFWATLGNFATRIAVSISFVLLVIFLSSLSAALVSFAWGISLLAGLTWFIAKSRGANAAIEIFKHLAVAITVVGASRMIGGLIGAYVH